MGDPTTKGIITEMDESACFIDLEAECVDNTNSVDDLFEQSTIGSNISNLIDDDTVDQGNSLALYNFQITEESERAVAVLKRKYAKSPQGSSLADISPRLEAISISPQKERQSKRKLFEDSGLGEDEVENISPQVSKQQGENGGSAQSACAELLKANCKRSYILQKFESFYGVPYQELVRHFKSDKTCCDNWIVFVYAAANDVLEASKILLQQHCDCLQIILSDFSGLYLIQFKHAKSRETIIKLFCNLMSVTENQLIVDPPKCRSTAAALYFYKKSISNSSFVFNSLPAWVTNLTLVNHQTAAQPEHFELAQMVQWAYDNHLTEESQIAYGYALLADEDSNAAAFLNSNCQVKYVRDCSAMVKLYFRQEMREMTTSQWIWKCCKECEEEGDWKIIFNYLKYQQVNIISFLTMLRSFLKKIPKKNCLVIYGPPDTGKSYFSFSFISFLKGKVVSYMNRNSNFWLQPLIDAKFGLMDDATHACWRYIDENMRNVLDGNLMCIDAKHKAPQQIHLPPLIITSNVSVLEDISFKYLHSRLMCVEFPNKMPFDNNGEPLYKISNACWKSFFKKLSRQLDLEDDHHESDRLDKPFRCTTECNQRPN
uniref:Replication protein E1 n=1 Tax=Human papillomavirus TaxID=10566 RepID=A0A385PI04_9PAPI|nr:MAG: E1 protein [Human papillomavirus]